MVGPPEPYASGSTGPTPHAPYGSTPQPSTAPLPNPITHVFQMGTKDLQDLLKGIVNQNPNPGSTSKDLKFADQAPFTGKPEDLEPMLREAELRFQVQYSIYNTPTKKAYYILTLFKSGNAKLWKEQYIRSRDEGTLCPGDSWTNFKAELQRNFKDVGSAQDAMQSLQKIQQGRMTVDEYNTHFRILVQKAGLDDHENNAILTSMYSQGLNRETAKRIILNGEPANLAAWMLQAATMDSYERRANQFFANAAKPKGYFQGKKVPWKPKTVYKPREQYDQGVPMEIDRLDPQEEKGRKEKGLCFVCGQEGHFANEHKAGGSNQPRQENSSHYQGKKKPSFQGHKTGGRPQPQKGKAKLRAIEPKPDEDKSETVRAQIRNIIAKNYKDTESTDYLHFIGQIEKKGF